MMLLMRSKPRRDKRSDLPWRLIGTAIALGLIVPRAVSTGAARRVITGLRRRHNRGGLGVLLGTLPGAPSQERPPLADPVSRDAAATTPTLDGSSIKEADLTQTNEDAASEPGPALDVGESDDAELPIGTASDQPIEPFDRQAIPEEQPLDAARRAAAGGGEAGIPVGSDPDSIPPAGADCPVAYPIKGNGRSGIYHLPGAFAYERTVPTVCFRSAESAERAGFRAARHR